MTVVMDASVVVAGLVDSRQAGRWAEGILCAGPLAAPHFMPVEVTSVLHKAVIAGDVSTESGAMAYADLLDLPVQLYPFHPLPRASGSYEAR